MRMNFLKVHMHFLTTSSDVIIDHCMYFFYLRNKAVMLICVAVFFLFVYLSIFIDLLRIIFLKDFIAVIRRW